MSTGASGPAHPSLLQDTTLADLIIAWGEREREAAHLGVAGYRAMAAALRCYACEVRIKAMICQRLNLEQLPKACKTHDLMDLIIYTGLWSELSDPANSATAMNWYILVRFNRNYLNALRYRPGASLPESKADDLNAALDDLQDGVLAWLSKPR